MNTDNNVNHQSDSRLSISQRNLYVDIVKAYQIRPRRIISKFLITLLCGLKVFVIYMVWAEVDFGVPALQCENNENLSILFSALIIASFSEISFHNDSGSVFQASSPAQSSKDLMRLSSASTLSIKAATAVVLAA